MQKARGVKVTGDRPGRAVGMQWRLHMRYSLVDNLLASLTNCARQTQNGTDSGSAKNKTDQSAQVEESRSGSGFLLHCKWVMWGALVAGCPVGVNIFHLFPGFFVVAVVPAALATNEIGYAGDTSAATVTLITDPGTTPTPSLVILSTFNPPCHLTNLDFRLK